ncbi:ABC transporter substrate-binding protein [Halorarum halobium]|uniref:ABC transporter substrate-binding protein n=1 Tax=Halorarum halobium TaxID=3075121 RepID=UPI0028AC5AF7|nr:ABC transporter substrate-binding protein [Halobaculum sp. XH14]
MKNTELTRRDYLKGTAGAGAAGLTGFAGCMGIGGGGNNELEVLHGWTGGDGAAAEDALVAAFEEEYPDMATNFSPIGGGGNENLDTVVANRLNSGDPPSAFAGWPGKNLTKYDGVLGNLTDVWENGMTDAHIPEAAELCQYDGEYRAMPIGSHRLNCLFYNAEVVEAAGVNPDDLNSADALLDALGTVSDETDAVPMAQAMQGAWTTLQLVGVVLLSTGGYDAYMSAVNGEGGRDAVRTAFETTREILENYINDDAASTNLTAANQKIINGEAAFIHQGNWAAGAYRNAEGFNYDEHWGHKTFPGTEGLYTFHIDSFIMPSDNPSPENTRTFMEFVGSEKAQVAFNQYKGSIPTRTGVDTSEFGPYLVETIEDFENAENLPPTIAHGLAVEPQKMTDLENVITNDFSGPYDVEAATDGFMSVVQG